MGIQRVTIFLTILNLLLLIVLLAHLRPLSAQEPAPVLRGRALQIVDDAGRVRASLSVLPASVSRAGDRSPETVLLRLITERGRPSVKISTSEESSVLSVIGPSTTKSTWITVAANGSDSSVVLKSENGREQSIKP
jgi:hypothetical protein